MIYINLIMLNTRVRFYYYLLYYYRRRGHRILMIMLTRARTHVSILYIIYIYRYNTQLYKYMPRRIIVYYNGYKSIYPSIVYLL